MGGRHGTMSAQKLQQHNILYLTCFANNGFGGQESLYYLVKHLDKNLFRPIVGLPWDGELRPRLSESAIDNTVVDLPKINPSNLKKIMRAFSNLGKLVRKRHVELIHTDSVRNTFYAGVIGRLANIPVVWHIRTSDHDRYDRLLYYLSTRIITVADRLKSRFAWDAGRNGKIETIYNGVDPAKFCVQRTHSKIRNRYGIPGDDLLISVVARIEPAKGQKYLIKAAEILKKNFQKFFIIFAGDIYDRSYMQECRNAAEDCGLHGQVIFTGHLDCVNELLAETDIVVLPSIRSEGFPRAVIEGMTAGIPVIATDIGGSPEAVSDLRTGFIVKPKDPFALAEKILELGLDGSLRKKIGEQARSRAINLFGIQKNVDSIMNLYKRVLKI